MHALPLKSGKRKNDQQSLPIHRQPIQPVKVQKEEDTQIQHNKGVPPLPLEEAERYVQVHRDQDDSYQGWHRLPLN